MNTPTHAMVLAAGFGLRMRPLTLNVPKPLIPVAGRTMLDRVFDHLDRAGVSHPVVNAHWLGKQILTHLADKPGIAFSEETELLETGGGIAKALSLLGSAPFYACNADVIWEDGASPALLRLAAAWDSENMDALLLVQPTGKAHGYQGAGDFTLEGDGTLTRRKPDATAPLVLTGVQILHPRLFEGTRVEPFSLNRLYDKAAKQGRLRGLIHDGAWYHVGTPEDLAATEKLLAGRVGAL